MNSRIEQLAEHVAGRAKALICEAEEEIQKAIDATVEIANDEEKEAVLTLPIGVRWGIDTNKVEVTVGVNVRHKFASESSLPDPDQPELMDRDGNPLPESLAKPMRSIRSIMAERIVKKYGNVKVSIPGEEEQP